MDENEDLACAIEEYLKERELKNELDTSNDVLFSLKALVKMQWKVMDHWK